MSAIRVVQDLLLLRRPITVSVQVPVSLASHHLGAALSQDIVLSGTFQLTRYYRGHLNQNQIKLLGPITTGNRQFCFLVEGTLSAQNAETLFDGKMYLTDGNGYQLVLAALTIFVFLAVVVRWGAILIAPIFWIFIYGMTQWHFQHYDQEITQLLTIVPQKIGSEPQF